MHGSGDGPIEAEMWIGSCCSLEAGFLLEADLRGLVLRRGEAISLDEGAEPVVESCVVRYCFRLYPGMLSSFGWTLARYSCH